MGETLKGTAHGRLIELEQAVSLPEGSKVLVSIEPVSLSQEERRQRIMDLKGAWKQDASLTGIFESIEKERRMYKEREVRLA